MIRVGDRVRRNYQPNSGTGRVERIRQDKAAIEAVVYWGRLDGADIWTTEKLANLALVDE